VLCCDDWCVLQPEGIVLYGAAEAGKLDKVKAAADAGAPMEWANPDRNGIRAVHIACARGHKDVVAFLGSRGADVNAVDDSQGTPLHYTASYGFASVCTTLLALGADPTAKNSSGKTAVDYARQQNKPECVAVLEVVSKAWATGERDMAAVLQADLSQIGLRFRVRLKLPHTATDAECEQAEAAWKASGGPEALAAVAAAVASGDRAKVAAAQKVLEEVAAAAGTAVSASFRFFLASKHAGTPVTITFIVQLSCFLFCVHFQ
jgi:hypothetical protein